MYVCIYVFVISLSYFFLSLMVSFISDFASSFVMYVFIDVCGYEFLSFLSVVI